MKEAPRHDKPSKRDPSRLPTFAAVFGVVGIGVAAAACGSEAGGPGQVVNNPTLEPTATRIIPTLEPTATLAAEPTATAEAVLLPEQITALVNEALTPFPDTGDGFVINIKSDIIHAENHFKQFEQDGSFLAASNTDGSYGNAAVGLGKLACANPENNEKLVEAWTAIKSLMKKFTEERMAEGMFYNRAWEGAQVVYYTPSCNFEN
ncbi:hypothetical protein A3G14_00380 [Candidatus Curtissbacteria bacterium RIFCSPLOWO2_12_FULL_38_9]|uniref:Uncharacterized protein n=2 Tax=Candidatus Curtissiibacteriota TaxID=1752717 RepID=A0A1F5GB58_9BACT|nr:MAG: hypothetical protein A3D04_00810 [Candidatus Curtissbacteria bacterium RIFCSPHIGHO2_02_FULL_40_16b]OGE14022.1 MAG: hypothetical protein A3G14_00380 [Candidatus Curtissbacteria bacterium RIFCSPLOWO2_12_FULL_38_9]